MLPGEGKACGRFSCKKIICQRPSINKKRRGKFTTECLLPVGKRWAFFSALEIICLSSGVNERLDEAS